MNIRNLTYQYNNHFFFTSCATLKPDQFVENQIEATKDNLELLNGKYSRKSINDSNRQSGDLFWNFFTRGYNLETDGSYFVNIKVIDEVI